jgi:hypothetical protein
MNYFPRLAGTVTLLISASKVARITGMSHRYPALCFTLSQKSCLFLGFPFPLSVLYKPYSSEVQTHYFSDAILLKVINSLTLSSQISIFTILSNM